MNGLGAGKRQYEKQPTGVEGWVSWLLVLQLLFLLCYPAPGHASVKNILVISHGQAAVYSKVVSVLRSNLAGKCNPAYSCPETDYTLSYSNSDTFPSSIPPDTSLIITLGMKAARAASHLDTGVPVVNALISKVSADQLGNRERQTLVFLDQPISRQINLARLVRKQPRLGILLGPSSHSYLPPLQKEVERQGVVMAYRELTEENQVGPLLKALLEESNILLALPDPLIFNRKTIFNILLSSYHNKIPVIGFSAAYVKAGALVAVYSSPEDIAGHLADIVREYQVSGNQEMPAILYPKYFSIAINHSVARSLGISLPDEADIVRQIGQETNR